MVKAKDFWDYLCNELDYRFFAGVPCKGLKFLYDNMNPEFMHYIPAANERIALGLVSGAWLAGVKGALFMDGNNIMDIMNLLLSFNKKYKVPALIICYDEKYYWAKQTSITSLLLVNFKVMKMDDDVQEGQTFRDNLDIVIKGIEKEKKSGIFFIGKGDLK